MRKWFILVILVFLLFPSTAMAQEPIVLETLYVHLWSEYDQPSVLMIYDFKVATDTPLPATVKMRIPKTANLTAVAYDSGSDLINTEFAGPVNDGNWQVVTIFVKEQATYHIEYYQPISRTGNDRSFTYQWTGDYAVNNFRIEVQVPDDSTSVKTNPALPFVPNQPFLNGRASASSLKAGQTYELALQYARTSEQAALLPQSQQVATAAPVTQNASGRVTLDNLPYILGGFGVLLILGAIYYFWRSNSLQPSKPRKRRRSASGDRVEMYCHECGTRARPEDRFCRVCGSRLRTD